MFNIFNRRKYIPDNKYMIYSRKYTDESIKKKVLQMEEREKNLINVSNNNVLLNQLKEDNGTQATFLIYFLSISSLLYYFLYNKR
jgi:hypothetical protein